MSFLAPRLHLLAPDLFELGRHGVPLPCSGRCWLIPLPQTIFCLWATCMIGRTNVGGKRAWVAGQGVGGGQGTGNDLRGWLVTDRVCVW